MALLQSLNYWSQIGLDLACLRSGIYVVGYPKSGTTWCAELLADSLEVPMHRPYASHWPSWRRYIYHTHRFVPHYATAGRKIYVLRDGRDVMVSWYLAVARQTSKLAHRNRWQAKLPRAFTPEHIRDNLPAFIRIIQSTRESSIPYREHVTRALRCAQHIVRYENLRDNTAGELQSMISALHPRRRADDAAVDRAAIDRAVDRCSLARQKQNPRDTSQREFLGKGKTGEWRKAFTRAAAEQFLTSCGDALVVARYEESDNWVDQCSDANE